LQQKREIFIKRAIAGQTDFPLANDELEARGIDAAR
jgi:hypothetical protein